MSSQKKCPDCGSLEIVEDSHYAQNQLVCAGFILTEGLLTTTYADEEHLQEVTYSRSTGQNEQTSRCVQREVHRVQNLCKVLRLPSLFEDTAVSYYQQAIKHPCFSLVSRGEEGGACGLLRLCDLPPAQLAPDHGHSLPATLWRQGIVCKDLSTLPEGTGTGCAYSQLDGYGENPPQQRQNLQVSYGLCAGMGVLSAWIFKIFQNSLGVLTKFVEEKEEQLFCKLAGMDAPRPAHQRLKELHNILLQMASQLGWLRVLKVDRRSVAKYIGDLLRHRRVLLQAAFRIVDTTENRDLEDSAAAPLQLIDESAATVEEASLSGEKQKFSKRKPLLPPCQVKRLSLMSPRVAMATPSPSTPRHIIPMPNLPTNATKSCDDCYEVGENTKKPNAKWKNSYQAPRTTRATNLRSIARPRKTKTLSSKGVEGGIKAAVHAPRRHLVGCLPMGVGASQEESLCKWLSLTFLPISRRKRIFLANENKPIAPKREQESQIEDSSNSAKSPLPVPATSVLELDPSAFQLFDIDNPPVSKVHVVPSEKPPKEEVGLDDEQLNLCRSGDGSSELRSSIEGGELTANKKGTARALENASHDVKGLEQKNADSLKENRQGDSPEFSVKPVHLYPLPSSAEPTKKLQQRAWNLQSDGTYPAKLRLHPVKPMHTTTSKSSAKNQSITSKILDNQNEADIKKYDPSDPACAYGQLTHSELIQLVLKQKDVIAKRDQQVCELKDYTDNLLVRVMEETSNILRAQAHVNKKAGKM
ncbi:TFIIB-type domain-containing protein [Podarcis lilfordi]|uniref:TFIIB-type domain-containing protein n=1 Tax=Podarcis lilfordi TaxID=74358 RepID=A0AA35K0S6_9SAUR|nr:TFIIB-type domain-containing protein [Podarcis lilfordi]